MLKHEDNPQIQTQPAAKVRVTPEELAAAVTALQTRKEGQPGTIAIGEAVEELGLDVTPEEVLAEVQARRQAIPRKRRSKLWDRLVLALGLSGILLWCSFFVMDYPTGGSPSTSEITTQGLSSEAQPSGHIAIAPNLTVGDASGKMLMLSEVGDDHPVRCTFDNQSSTFQYYYPSSPALWTLIKHHGKVYVRGWMLNVSEKVRAENGVDIAYHRDENFNTPITLPLDGFKVQPVVGSVGSFHAVNVQFDKHAYEKW